MIIRMIFGMVISLLATYAIITAIKCQSKVYKQSDKKWRGVLFATLILVIGISIYTKSALFFIWGLFYAFAALEDISEMEVYDSFHFAPMTVIIAMLGVRLLDMLGIGMTDISETRISSYTTVYHSYTSSPDMSVIISLVEYVIILIFILTSWKARGTADDLMMINILLYGIYFEIEGVYILISMFMAHIIQFIYQLIHCKRIGIKYKDKEKLPFIPALYVCSIGLFTVSSFGIV